MRVKFLIVSMVVTIFACKAQQINPTKITEKNRQLLMATLYFQKAAENRALYHQAFNFARLSLDKDLETNTSTQKRAVVVDIDETLLDNSPFEAKCILEGTSYPKYWSEWTAQASAEALPGAQEFLNYAASKGVEVFYISNRKTNEYDATLKNLSEKGFPMVDSKHLVLRTTTSNKEDRRQALLNDYRIVMLAGDNLNDFTAIFEKQNSDRRNTLVDSLKNDFGKKFIILPNSMYGDWENALFNYNNQLTESQKDSIRLSNLKSF